MYLKDKVKQDINELVTIAKKQKNSSVINKILERITQRLINLEPSVYNDIVQGKISYPKKEKASLISTEVDADEEELEKQLISEYEQSIMSIDANAKNSNYTKVLLILSKTLAGILQKTIKLNAHVLPSEYVTNLEKEKQDLQSEIASLKEQLKIKKGHIKALEAQLSKYRENKNKKDQGMEISEASIQKLKDTFLSSGKRQGFFKGVDNDLGNRTMSDSDIDKYKSSSGQRRDVDDVDNVDVSGNNRHRTATDNDRNNIPEYKK